MNIAALAVWRDPRGAFSPLKSVLALLLLSPAMILAWRTWSHDLGGRPITEAIHVSGDWAIRILVMSLAVTPARHVLQWPRVVITRRMFGVTSALYAICHFWLYIFDQGWNIKVVGLEILRRYYLTIGFTAFVVLVALLVTSTDRWQRRLGVRWKKLHRWVFLATPLALLHFYMQSKANVSDAVFVSGLFFWLALWRVVPRSWHFRPTVILPVLTVMAAVTTAVAEALWYGLATRISGWQVLQANFGLDARPAALVLMCGALVSAVGIFRHRRAVMTKVAT